MGTNDIPEELLQKIKKLIKLEEGAKAVGNLEEAQNAASKVRDMLMKYNLDMYKVLAAGDKSQKEQEITDIDYDPESLTKPHEGDWVTRLVKSIARFYMCDCIGISKSKNVCIIGTSTNVEILWYTVEQLTNRIRPLSREAFKEYKGHEKRNTFFRGFFRGAVEGIRAQLAEKAAREVYRARETMQDLKTNEAYQSSTEDQKNQIMLANMLVKNEQKIQAYMRSSMYVSASKGKGGRGLSSQSGRQQGYETGKNMNINSGIGSGHKVSSERWLN